MNARARSSGVCRIEQSFVWKVAARVAAVVTRIAAASSLPVLGGVKTPGILPGSCGVRGAWRLRGFVGPRPAAAGATAGRDRRERAQLFVGLLTLPDPLFTLSFHNQLEEERPSWARQRGIRAGPQRPQDAHAQALDGGGASRCGDGGRKSRD